MFEVHVTNSRGATDEVTCTGDICSIGKSDENLIVIHGWGVARTHATILSEPDGLFVRDEGSRGGTRVNGERVEDKAGPLTPRDAIVIGGYNIAVTRADDSGEGAVQSAVVAPAPAVENVAVASADAGEPIATADPEPSSTPPKTSASRVDPEFNARLRMIHDRIIARLDFRRINISQLDEVSLRERTHELISEIIDEDPELAKGFDRERMTQDALNEAVGLGPLEKLLADDSISEIMVNRFDEIFIERSGRLQTSEIVFSSDKSVLSAIERIVAPLGRRIDESSPMVDGRLSDGSRVNAVIPPLALKGPNITIRKFSKNKLEPADVVRFGSADERMIKFLQLCVEQRCNVLIAGGTGSGKTTLLNILSNFIPDGERVITVEDSAELQLYMSNLISLESRPSNVEGSGEVSIRDLVRNCLRMRPDRIVVGECRGGESLDMLQAMNTGHDGSLTTVHANSPRDTLARLEVMVMMAGMDLPAEAIRQQISSAINVVVQQARLGDGSRKITHVTEVTGMENGVIQLQNIFTFEQEGYDSERNVVGGFKAAGRVPEFYEDLAKRGVDIDRSIFFEDGVGI